MRKGICCAGNIIVDHLYPISKWPKESELVHITEGIGLSTGGAVCNTIIDLAKLDPKMHLVASGYAGHDTEGDLVFETMGKYPNIDLSAIRRDGRTSFTVVMSDNENKARTFFQHAGANAKFGEDDIPWEDLDVNIFHIGYILLLPLLDEEDSEYGTKMARLLHRAQQNGMKTSIDVVSESGDRFKRLVKPAMKYCNYCIINELEAQQTTGVLLREEDGTFHPENLKEALAKMHEFGVTTWAVIHCPEIGAGMDEKGNYVAMPSLALPKGYIAGTVGAGDAFCAGVLYSAESGKTLEEALKIGACTAAASLSEANASDGVKTVDEVLKLYDLYGN